MKATPARPPYAVHASGGRHPDAGTINGCGRERVPGRHLLDRDVGGGLAGRGLDPGTASGLDGISTLEFENGRWFQYGTVRGPGECTGPYSVDGGRLVVTITPRCGGSLGMLFSAAWTVEGSALTFTELTSDTDSQAFVDAVWGNRVWERIG